jgi:hypothetical protein
MEKIVKYILIFLLFINVVYSKESKQTVQDYFEKVCDKKTCKIQALDVKNGYIKFYPLMAEGFGEFVIWKTKDKKILAGTVNYSCGSACVLSDLRFYEFSSKHPNGQLVKEKVFSEKKMKELYQKHLEKIEARGASGDETLWVKLPREGKDIEFGIMSDQNGSDTFVQTGLAKFNGTKFEISRTFKD